MVSDVLISAFDLIHHRLYSPVIIIGMHRSGTSMLAEVLHQSGIHMGEDRDHNFEALHFLSINQRAMWKAGADWFKPIQPPDECFDHPGIHELFKIHFKIHGNRKYLLHKLLNKPWGWKDPRNTFTLPYWLQLFPEAKVIHLIRHGWDVALSLQNRNKIPGEAHHPDLDDPMSGFALWNKYVSQAMAYAHTDILHIRYEDLILHQKEPIEQLESFLNTKIKAHLTATAKQTRRTELRYPDIICQNEWINKFYSC
ncbi:MAG: sulfotransferase [Thermaurantimonas sp.]